jgi:hypothetical protein
MRRITVEIVVGFIGVYAAFALTAYKERRDQVERRHQIKRALIAEKQGGGLNLIDVPTFVALAQFYNMNSQSLSQYGQLRDFSIREILPRSAAGPNAFFVPGTTKLLPSFELYGNAMRRLGAMDQSTVSNGDSLLVRLARDTT